MRSIRTKITLMTLAAIVVSVLAVGGIGIYSIKSEGDRNATLQMCLLCDNQRKSLNEYLDSIEQSVNMVSRYVTRDLNVVNLVSGGVAGEPDARQDKVSKNARQRHLEIYLSAHSRRAQTVFSSVANHTNGVISYYYRFNPALSDVERGFWYTGISSTAFVEADCVDISAFDPSDMEHVGWYSIPKQRGRPSWLAPYHNDNLNLYIVSYIAPIYKAGTFIGVVGMDIRWETLVDQIRDMQVYDTGYACLADQDGQLLYHPTLPAGTNINDMNVRKLSDMNASQNKNNITLLSFTSDGAPDHTPGRVASTLLDNDLQLLIVAPEREISAGWRRIINIIIIAGTVIFAVFGVMAFAVMKHIIDPLRSLANASRRLAEGEYNLKLEYHENDEVGVLTQSFLQMASHLNAYITDLNSRAYKDALTGIRNKGAFDIFMSKLSDRLEVEDKPQFAIVMLDCNKLKQINDVFGHEKGDIYLQTATRIICGVFAHSPVFRIGGDEFVAILQNGDFDKRVELFQTFDERAAEINAFARNAWERVSVAKGIAIYDPNIDPGVDSVFRRADENMYANKKQMKAGR